MGHYGWRSGEKLAFAIFNPPYPTFRRFTEILAEAETTALNGDCSFLQSLSLAVCRDVYQLTKLLDECRSKSEDQQID